MKSWSKAVVTIVVCIAAVVSLTTFLTLRLFERTTEQTEGTQYALMRSIVQFNLTQAESQALARAELVASMPKVRQLFAEGKRDALAAELLQMFAAQKEKFSMEQSQFALANNVSFLRLNAPDKHGDDLGTFRPIIVAVNADHVARRGLSISRSGPGIFGVVPVTHNGKHVGTFEFGSDFPALLERLKKAYGLESTLFMDEARMKQAAPSLPGDVYDEKNRVGRFVKFHSTDWAVMSKLVSDVELSTSGIENAPYTREAGEVPYGVVVTPLTNPAGDKLGYVVSAKNFSATQAALNESLMWLAFLSLVGVTVLTVIVAYVFHNGIGKPLKMLNERFAALVDGSRRDPAAGKPETYYGEVGSLAKQYEKLRHVM